MYSARVRKAAVGLLTVAVLLSISAIASGSAGAVAPKIDVDGTLSKYLAVKTAPDGSVWAKRFSCSSASCMGSSWTNLGGFVSELRVSRVGYWDDLNFVIVGRGADGFIWYRWATCPNSEQCSYGPWIYTGGFGYDIQLHNTGASCIQLAVIGGDRGVWLTSICQSGAGGWLPLGGVVTDIAYTGDRLYGIDPWNRLWVQMRVNGLFRGNWNNLGGYVRSPVPYNDNPISVLAIGGDNAVWQFNEGAGWQRLANASNVGDLRGHYGAYSIIHTNFSPDVCTSATGGTLPSFRCTAQGGLVTSMTTTGSLSVGIGTDNRSYYKRFTTSGAWAEL